MNWKYGLSRLGLGLAVGLASSAKADFRMCNQTANRVKYNVARRNCFHAFLRVLRASAVKNHFHNSKGR